MEWVRCFLPGLETLFFDLLQFSVERLLLNGWAFAPGLAVGFRLGGIKRHFAAVHVLVTLFLARQRGTQFVFRHGWS
ncbi:hypothetical protein P4154_25865 [Pseudomonas aeruginosa]|nr:hypothetical protein [Pseudomonas aeruginosa]